MLNRTATRYIFTIALLLVLLYGTFVLRHVFHEPIITLDQPTFIETDRPTLTISGNVQYITALSINTKPLLFEKTGRFEQTRTLPDGISTIILEGTDRFGRSTDTMITVNKKPGEFIIPESEEEDIATKEISREDSKSDTEETTIEEASE